MHLFTHKLESIELFADLDLEDAGMGAGDVE